MKFTVEVEQETDGRWIAEVIDLAGTMTYGKTREEAMAKVQALALRVVADRLEHAEAAPELVSVVFDAVCADGPPRGPISCSRHSSA